MALGFSTTSSPGFSLPSAGTGSSGYATIPGLSLNSGGFVSTTKPSSLAPTWTPNITPTTPWTPSPTVGSPSNLSGFGSGSGAGTFGTSTPLPRSQPYSAAPPSYGTGGSGGTGYDPSIGAGNPLAVPNIPDAERVQAHIAEVVQASAARIGAMQSAVAERAHAAQIGAMDQITAEKLNREDELKIRAEQVSLNEQLKAVVAGTAGPSVAELQYQRTSEQAARQQMGYAAARGTGGNYGLAMREAGINQGLIQAQQSQGAAELRAKEVAEARNQMAQLQTAIRAADIAVATTEANYRQQANMFNAEQVNAAKIRQAELNTQVSQLNAQLGTQVNMFNAGQENAATIRQAELETQTSMFNAGETNTTNRFNAGSQNQADQFNSSLASQIAQTRAQLQSNTEQFNSTDSRIREMAEKQRQQDIINRATDYNNQVTRDQAQRDFASTEAQKARDAAAAEHELDRVNRIKELAIQSAATPMYGAGGASGGPGGGDAVSDSTMSGIGTGAMAGSKFGPVGVVVGAAIGGVGGYITGRGKEDAQLQAYRDAWRKKHDALIAAGLNPADYPESAGGTSNLGGALGGANSQVNEASQQMRAQQQAADNAALQASKAKKT